MFLFLCILFSALCICSVFSGLLIILHALPSSQVKQRLEQLDDLEEGSLQEQMDLSQAEYIKRIEDFNQVRNICPLLLGLHNVACTPHGSLCLLSPPFAGAERCMGS